MLRKLIQLISHTVKGHVVDFILPNFANPNVVFIFVGVEEVKFCVWLAQHG